MAERIPPHNDDAEKSVLGAAMLSNEVLTEISSIVKPDDFYNPMHKEIFTAIIELQRDNKVADILTVAEELNKRKALELAGGRAYIAELPSFTPSPTNAPQYAKIVAEKAMLRNMITTSEGIIDKCYEEATETGEVLAYAESGIFQISQRRQTRGVTDLGDVLMKNINLLDEAIKHKGEITGIPTGFKDLDSKLSGLNKSDLIILAARPAMGKTAFALNIALNAAKEGKASVMIFSLEMSDVQLGMRLLSMESMLETQKIKEGNVNEKELKNVLEAVENMSKRKIFIDETPGITLTEMRSKCRKIKAEKGLDLIIVDYLQLIAAEGRSESRIQEVSNMTRNLKLLAREIDCPVIVLSQLSRAPEQRQDHRPILADLRESGSIEQDADIVLFLYRDEYYNEEKSEKPGVCDVIIAKHRSGSTGTVELTWLSKFTRFGNKA